MTLRILTLIALVAAPAAASAADRECVQSPGKVIELCVSVGQGEARYEVRRNGKELLAPARLGLDFKGEPDARVPAQARGGRGGGRPRPPIEGGPPPPVPRTGGGPAPGRSTPVGNSPGASSG